MAITPTAVEEGELIHIAHQIAGQRFHESNGATGPLNHANPRQSLAGSANLPEGFEKREVAPIEQKYEEK